MKINDTIHGFTVLRHVEIPEVSGTLYEMKHTASGATLAYLDREDENKTFAIGFKTIPSDDTGVFHIIEHSVLCGSDKYPVKEPFVELLKGSQNTFLNAMTYEDRTVYPVSSRNPKDFLNLVNVYMDAVLHPRAAKNPQIFRQEGWHYEFDPEGRLIYNGVVFNEMKGAYSSADEISVEVAKTMLFPDTLYRHDSGGAPTAIPDLTFEQFTSSHARFYHPSNSYIVLDGTVDLDATLGLIDSFLADYTPIAPADPILPQVAVDGGEKTVHYEIAESEDPVGKCRLSLNYVYGLTSDSVLTLATGIINDALLGSNDSPLKKAVLESGLAEDLAVFINRTVQQSIQIEARGVKEENLGTLEELIKSKIREIAKVGIDKETLRATLNATEFKLREKDYGSFPKGVAFALSVFGATNYGLSPESALSYEEDIKALRAAIETDYFENLLLAMTVDNPHRAKHIMLPDKSYGKQVADEERARLDKVQSSLTPEEIEDIKKETEALKAWQASTDTPEALATLPHLDIEDIYVSSKVTPTVVTHEPYEVISHPIDTAGIGYYTLLFDASDLTLDELFTLNAMTMLFSNVATEKHSPLEVQNLIKSNLGELSFSASVIGPTDTPTPYLAVRASALDSKREDMKNIIREVLLTSDIGDKNALKNLLLQWKMILSDTFTQAGHSLAIGRARASFKISGTISEYFEGIEAYKLLCTLIDNFDSQIDAFIEKIQRIFKTVVVKERVKVAVTGELDHDYLSSLIDILPSGSAPAKRANIKPLGFKSEGIIIPTRVSYAVLAAYGGDLAVKNYGALCVSRSVLSYEYLWNQIRVLGGAYGAGFLAVKDGTIGCYSYRDPSPINSIKKYKECGSFLKAFAADKNADLTKFIIGAVGDYDLMRTPRLAGELATSNYLNGWSDEQDKKVLSDMKSADKDAIRRAGELVDRLVSDAVICVVGSREQIEGNKDKFDSIIEI